MVYTCDTTIASSYVKLASIVKSVATKEMLGLNGCCAEWDEAFKIYGAIWTYNKFSLQSNKSSNDLKKCVCWFLGRRSFIVASPVINNNTNGVIPSSREN